jgi:hypothetical protein
MNNSESIKAANEPQSVDISEEERIELLADLLLELALEEGQDATTSQS